MLQLDSRTTPRHEGKSVGKARMFVGPQAAATGGLQPLA